LIEKLQNRKILFQEDKATRIKEVKSYSDFIAMKDRWKYVLERSEHSVFSTWEWLSTWWKYFGKNKQLLILVAKENERIVGIAPLMYSVYTMFGLRQGKIELIGTPHSDYNDFILTDKQQNCMQLFLNYLNSLSENWSSLELTDIPENGNFISSLHKISSSIRPLHKCPYAPLPKSYDALLSGLKRKHRKELGRNLRRLEKEGFKVDFVDYSRTSKIADGMNTLFDLHQKRWKQKGFSGVFADQDVRSFNLDIARLFSKEGWLGLYSLELSGKPVAMLYGFKYKHKYYAYISGIDPVYCKYSVGNLLFLQVMNKCIQDKIAVFDFMRGAEDYKDRWSTIAKWNLEVIVPRAKILAGFRYSLYRKYWSEGARLKWLFGKLLKKKL
jgi:CelD/BcsL family acetyltransferase involved in cellulose biosynthesis